MFCCCAQEPDRTAETVRIFDGDVATAEDVGIVQTQSARTSVQPEPPPEKEPAKEVEKQEAQAVEEKVQPEEQAPLKSDEYSNIVVGTPLQFTVSVKKAAKTTPVGLELDTAGGTCAMVTKIVDGVVQTYNKTAPGDRKVFEGDVIMQVNQAVGDTKTMGQQAMQSTTLDLVVKRPVEFLIKVDKSESPGVLGIDFEYLAVGRSLLIKSVKQGLIQKWNDSHSNLEVRRLDRIVGVNGYKGESEKLLEMMKQTDELQLTIARIFSAEELKAN